MHGIDLEFDRICTKEIAETIYVHMPKLRELARGCEHVVELGTGWRHSTTALVAGRPKRITTYDLQDRSDRDLLAMAAEVGVDLRFVKGNTVLAEIEPADLLFVDSTHTYEHLKAELARHADRATRLLAFHDTEVFGETGWHSKVIPAGLLPDRSLPLVDTDLDGGRVYVEGVGRAIEELLADGAWKRTYHSKECYGFTVLERK